MKYFILIRTVFLLVFVLGAIPAEAKDVYITTGTTGPAIDASTPTNPAPYSELREFLSDYSVDGKTDKQLNVYFETGTYLVPNVLTFESRDARVDGLEVTFQPITPSNGAGKKVIFDGTGTSTSRFIRLRGDRNHPMTLSIVDVKIQNFTSARSSDDGASSLFTIPEGASLTLDNVVVDQIESQRYAFVFQREGSFFTAKNATLSNIITNGTSNQPVINSTGLMSFEHCTVDTWETNSSTLIVSSGSGSGLSLYDCIVRDCVTGGPYGNRLINAIALEVTACEFINNDPSGNLLYFESGTITNSVFSGNTPNGSIIHTNTANKQKEITNNLFTKNVVTTPLINNQNGDMLLSENTFTENNVTGTTLVTVTTGATEIHTNSFVDNTANDRLVNFTGGTSVMYNNTLSGNGNAVTAIALATANVRVINNTVYNSGNVSVTNTSAKVMNNIVAGSSRIRGAQANATTCQRNISGSVYYLAGIAAGEDISAAFSAQFKNKPSGTGNGKIVHELTPSQLGAANHAILQRGGKLSDIAIFSSDQRGIKRPPVISIGSVDLQDYVISDPDLVVMYNSRYASSKTPAPLTIDISNYILSYPFNITDQKTSITLSGTTLPNGTLSPLPLPAGTTKITFSPKITGGEYTGGSAPATFYFTLTATDGDISYSKTGAITISVLDLGIPPGLIKPSDFPTTCYDYMGTVAFTSSYRFITSFIGSSDPVTNQTGKPINPPEQRMYGFSIPLVGDLDGDGYPEIIGTGRRDGTDDLAPYYNCLYIYNGQTGKLISRLPFDLKEGKSEADRNSGSHSSPSILALVNSDGDRVIEVIAAFPGSSSGSGAFPFTNKLVSYTLNPEKSGGVTTGYKMALNPKWPATPPTYNAGAPVQYQKPIPQIVDIDGNGEPEVVVYNKIYSAKTGELKVELETLGSTAYVGSAMANADTQDAYINFSYIYDLDFDGKYDVAAGGKVYYDIDVDAGTYKVRDFSAIIKDGRTGVADIDGDGIPDVVVVNRHTDASTLDIYVWDPGLLEIDGNNNVVSKAPLDPLGASNLKAHRALRFGRPDHGTNSYVYIGDIDGRGQQSGNGETHYLPEIAVLAGRLTYSADLIHPNVANMGIPTSGNSSGTGAGGVLAAVTWDHTAQTPDTRLKLSFVLGHNDTSGNTGFTMFDFDNDGLMEICYRDEATLRIIKASTPYVTDKSVDPNIVLFNRPAISYTGFEYPVIADIDNDASAEVIVLGHNASRLDAYGFIYALGNGTGDKFAPALPVWNQFMYDPFKINPDLTTPKGPAPNRLVYKYNKRIAKNDTTMVIRGIQPYNNTLGQIF
jgi:hypothetical protein